MAKEAKDKNTEHKQKEYLIKRCVPCGLKLHVSIRDCPKCGKRVDDMVYGSRDPDDWMLNLVLNKVEKCMSCFNAMHGTICKYAICFGTGKGNCEICRRTTDTRFYCCQEEQQKEKGEYK